jgi:hypothetical protein
LLAAGQLLLRAQCSRDRPAGGATIAAAERNADPGPVVHRHSSSGWFAGCQRSATLLKSEGETIQEWLTLFR